MGLGLAGRHCFVTGASAGIGRGTALALGAEGALLSIAGRDEDALLVTGDMIVAQGASVLPSLPATCRSLPASTPRLRRSRRLNARSRYNAGGGRPYNLDAPLDAEAWGIDRPQFHRCTLSRRERVARHAACPLGGGSSRSLARLR